MTAPTVPTAPLPSELPPADYDKAYNRHYLPLPGGWEVQTKGNGSSFRIAGPDNFRLLIPDQPYVHETLERMARDIREAVCAMQKKDGACTMGVGDGSGKLFVHGDYDSIKAAQAIVLERDELRRQLAASERTCAELRARIAKYRARLEVDHHWRDTEAPGQLVRVDNPPDVDETYDGIACRDETIKLGDDAYKELKARAEAAERTVEGLMERADVEVCCAQAVEFAEYVTEHAKGKMVEAAQRFLSLPYSQELAAKLKRAPSA